MKKLRNSMLLIVSIALIWAVAMVLFVFFRFWDGGSLSDWRARDLVGSTQNALWLTALGGFLVGIISELLELFIFGKMLRRVPTPIIILVKSVAQFLILIIYIVSLIYFFDFYEKLNYPTTAAYIKYYFTPADVLPLMIYVFSLILFLSIFRRLYRLVGPLNFGSVMLGRYNRPREEERIFMFLDLNSSTELAESLGHKKVSRLIQECFNDLASISLNYKAQTYQYVGDEVVLTWKCSTGYEKSRCIDIYFAFQDLLQKRGRFYNAKFGMVPQFKCALHAGKVISTQVGQLKVEIAFHGDVLNTTARMLEKCHEYGENFIISDDIYAELKGDESYLFKKLGSTELRGKVEKVGLHGVTRSLVYGSKLEELPSAGLIF